MASYGRLLPAMAAHVRPWLYMVNQKPKQPIARLAARNLTHHWEPATRDLTCNRKPKPQARTEKGNLTIR